MRSTSHAINAFGIETSNAISTTKNSISAMSRLGFWHRVINDTIKNEGTIKQHPILVILHPHLKENEQMRESAKKVIKAREKWVLNPIFQQLKDLEDYAEDTASSLLLMHLAVINTKRKIFDMSSENDSEAEIRQALSHLGRAIGICRWIMGIPKSIEKRKETGIPNELLMKHGLDKEQIYQDHNKVSLSMCINDMVHTALTHYNRANQLFKKRTSNHADFLFLHAVWVHRFLKHVNSCNISSLKKPDAMLALSMWWRWKRKRIF